MCKTDKPVDWTKPIQARDGRPARLMGHLNSTSYESRSYFVAFQETDCSETWVQVYPNGRASRDSEMPYDVINVPARVSGYVNVYLHPSTKPYLGGSVFDTASAADQNSSQNRVARIRVDIEEGRYDE